MNMRQIFGSITMVFAAFALTACSSNDEPGQKQDQIGGFEVVAPLSPDQNMKEWLNGQTSTAVRVMEELATQEGNSENFIFSPYSLQNVLAMMANGGGQHEADLLLDFLNTENLETLNLYCPKMSHNFPYIDRAATFLSARSIWGRAEAPVQNEFMSTMKDTFGADIFFLPEDTPDLAIRVNEWVRDFTKGLIPELFEPKDYQDETGSDKSRIILADALYFKAPWTKPFDPKDTKVAAFTNLDGSTSQVKMMNIGGLTAQYMYDDKAQSVTLPMGDGKFSLTFILPYEGVTISDFATSVTADELHRYCNGVVKHAINLSLPKFDASYALDGKDVLTRLGLGDLFSLEADWSKIFGGSRRLKLASIAHKVKFSIDEKGGEGAAGSGAIFEDVALPNGPTPLLLTFDRPFIFVLTENACSMPIAIGGIVSL